MVGRDAFCLSLEIHNQSVTQSVRDHFLDIVETNIESAASKRADFRRENYRLSSAWAAAKSKILVGDRNCSFRSRMRREDQSHRIILHMRSNRHLADELLKIDHLRAIQHFIDFDAAIFCGAIDNFGEISSGGI